MASKRIEVPKKRRRPTVYPLVGPARHLVTRSDLVAFGVIQLADLGRYPSILVDCGLFQLRRYRRDACFVVASFHQAGQGDPRQLISKRDCQNVVMQALGCGRSCVVNPRLIAR